MNGFITRISTIVTFDTRREDERALLLRYVLISLLIVLTSKNVCHFSVIPCKRTLAQKCKEIFCCCCFDPSKLDSYFEYESGENF